MAFVCLGLPSDVDIMVRNLGIFSIFVSIIFFMSLPNLRDCESNIAMTFDLVYPRLTLEIDTNDKAVITVEDSLQQRNHTTQCFLLLPFIMNEKISHSPSEAFCSWENYENQYSIFSMLCPPQTSKLEIKGSSQMLIAPDTDWRKLVIDFEYENAPVIIEHLMKSNQTIWKFNIIKIVFPIGVDTTQVFEMPPPSKSTDNTHEFRMENILSIGGGMLSIKYPIKGAFWYYEMALSLIFGVPTAVGIFLIPKDKIKPPESRKTQYFFIFIPLSVWIATFFFTVKLVSCGPTWDEISKYYPALLLNAAAMINWVRHALNPVMRFLV